MIGTAARRHRARRLRGLLGAFLLVSTMSVPLAEPVAAHPGRPEIVSRDQTDTPRRGLRPSLTADGSLVVFESWMQLVAGDTDNDLDVYLHDRATGTTSGIAVDAGTDPDTHSNWPYINSEGTAVAFQSTASDLVADDTNGARDVFVYDLSTGAIERVSVSSDESEGDGLSGGGPTLSSDGTLVVFASAASNLVAGDTNEDIDIFVRDRESGTTARVSISSDGGQTECGDCNHTHPTISGDGRYVAFASDASDLVTGDNPEDRDVFIHDRQTGATALVSVGLAGAPADDASFAPSVSHDGRFVKFDSRATNLVPGDTNGRGDIFVRDMQSGATSRASVASDGRQSTSGDVTIWPGSISADGRVVAWSMTDTDIVPGDTNQDSDILVHDRQTGRTIRASIAWSGGQAGSESYGAELSADGSTIAFDSRDVTLSGETTADESPVVYVRDLHDLYFVNDTPLTDISGSPFEHEIVWAYHEGITVGCNAEGTRFCPTAPVKRDQMASFLVRARDLPSTSEDYFVDDEGSVHHEADINALYEAEITTGCGTDEVEGGPPNLLYCPTLDVTRAQMASFIARAFQLPDAPTDYDPFTDDDDEVVHEDDINRVAYAGITFGCNEAGDNFCPDVPVSREQMAAFLFRASGD